MNPWTFLPNGYEPPFRNEPYLIAWRPNLGPRVTVGEVGDYLHALQTLIDLGERWGLVVAEEAAARSLIAELFANRQSNVDLSAVRDVMSDRDEKRVSMTVSEMLSHSRGDHPESNVEVPSVVRELASFPCRSSWALR